MDLMWRRKYHLSNCCKPTKNEPNIAYISSVIMVVGAGRGPLVNCSIRAAEKAQRKVKLYAVEKNPNALVTYVSTHIK